MTNLYLDSILPIQKTAAETVLPEDPNQWSQEILQEAYKQIPFISDFEPHTVMDRIDGERGFAFGHIEISNKTELQQGASDQAKDAVGVKSVRIPVVVKDKKLQPLDLIVTGDSKVLPLTERRLKEALFRPQTFDVTSKTPGDTSMASQIYPPHRDGSGMGGAGGMMGKTSSDLEYYLREQLHVETKTAEDKNKAQFAERLSKVLGVDAKKLKGFKKDPNESDLKTSGHDLTGVEKSASLLEAILPTALSSDLTSFAHEMKDVGVQQAYVKNAHATLPSINKIWNTNQVTSEKVASSMESAIRPSVIQVSKENVGYRVKEANHKYWQVKEAHSVSRGDIIKHFGVKLAQDADEHGSVTVTDDAVGEGAPLADLKPITEFGTYKVQNEEGTEMMGLVFPNLTDLDGTVLPIALFTNGSAAAVQPEIAGSLQSTNGELMFGSPTGTGVFVRQSGDETEATIPMTIKGKVTDGEQKLHVETYDGRECTVSLQPNIQKPTQADEGTFLLPKDYKWMGMGKAESVVLVSAPEGGNKVAHAQRKLASVTVRAGGVNSFSFEGFPIDKLASDEKHFLSFDDSLFLLGGLGTDLGYAQTKLAQAIAHGMPVDVRVGRHIQPAESVKMASRRKSQEKLASSPAFDLKRNLFKEAAFIPDPTSVDTILSIGFVNPENIHTFVSYLPEINSTQAKLCELLMSSRLGLSKIPQGPLEKCVKYLEDVIEGLKTLAFQQALALGDHQALAGREVPQVPALPWQEVHERSDHRDVPVRSDLQSGLLVPRSSAWRAQASSSVLPARQEPSLVCAVATEERALHALPSRPVGDGCHGHPQVAEDQRVHRGDDSLIGPACCYRPRPHQAEGLRLHRAGGSPLQVLLLGCGPARLYRDASSSAV